MGSNVEKIRNEALSLPVSERASLAHDLILSLEEPSDLDLDTDTEAEIARRAESVRNGSSESRSASHVFADVRARYAK